jgi:hypothetical protein
MTTPGIDATGTLRLTSDSRERSVGRAKTKRQTETRDREVMAFEGTTTNATATEIFINGPSSNRFTLPVGFAAWVSVQAVAMRTDGAKVASEKHNYVIKNVAGTVTLLETGSPTVVEHIGESTYVVALINDTNVLKLKVTGAVSETVKWAVRLDSVQIKAI